MKKNAGLAFVLLVALALGFVLGRSGTPQPAVAQMPAMAGNCFAMHPGPVMPPSIDRSFMEPMITMQCAMRQTQLTGNADKDFMLLMIPHHQAAIDMAKVELTHGKDARVRTLATNVINAQTHEIATMHSWLSGK